MKKVFCLFAIVLSLALITGCGKKKEENGNSNNIPVPEPATKQTTITCTELDNEDIYAVATLDKNDKVVKIISYDEEILDSEADAQEAYSYMVEAYKAFDKISGLSYNIGNEGKKITFEVEIEMSELKSFVDNNPDESETLSLDELVMETAEEFKEYAKENNLKSCITQVGQN